MGWTVIIEDENGKPIKTMPHEFVLSDEDILYQKPFHLLKYIDPYGDTTFNAFMFDELITDLEKLKNYLPTDSAQINMLINYTIECKNNVHTYLKFYGD
jgi:hypothetical protein